VTSPSDRRDSPSGVSRQKKGPVVDQRPLVGRRGPPEWVVGVAGFAIGAAIVLRLLLPAGMDPTIFLAFGEDAPAQTAYGRALLGDVASRPGAGHDGKFFFIQANDPWYLDPERNADVLDLPLYRGERMLFPMIAGGFGWLPPGAIVWSLLATNLFVFAVGAALAARLASFWGATTWLGLSVPLNIGLLYELVIDGAGVLAYACCLAALFALFRERTGISSLLFTAAALSREVMLAFALGVFLLWWIERRKLPWLIVIAPVLALGVWTSYLVWRLAGISGTGTELTFLSPPFFGLVQAFGFWIRYPGQILDNVAMLALVLAFVPLAIRSRSPIAWGALPFVAMSVVLSIDVFLETPDLARVFAPVFTAAPFLHFVRSVDEPVRMTGPHP